MLALIPPLADPARTRLNPANHTAKIHFPCAQQYQRNANQHSPSRHHSSLNFYAGGNEDITATRKLDGIALCKATHSTSPSSKPRMEKRREEPRGGVSSLAILELEERAYVRDFGDFGGYGSDGKWKGRWDLGLERARYRGLGFVKVRLAGSMGRVVEAYASWCSLGMKGEMCHYRDVVQGCRRSGGE